MITNQKRLAAVPTSGRTVHVQKRELGEVANYAITAFKKKVPVDSIFALCPTDATGYLAAYVQKALEHHLGPWAIRRPPAERVRVIEHALRAHRENLAIEETFTIAPTKGNVSMAAFVDEAIEWHLLGAAID